MDFKDFKRVNKFKDTVQTKKSQKQKYSYKSTGKKNIESMSVIFLQKKDY